MLAGDSVVEQSEAGSSSSRNITELELETALFKSMTQARPVGRHKHFQIISLQSLILHRTGLLIPVNDLWTRVGDLYDLEALDDLSTTSTSSSTSSSPIRSRPRESSFRLPLTVTIDDSENDMADADSWRRTLYEQARRDGPPEEHERDMREWSKGVHRQLAARSRSRGGSSSLSEQEEDEDEAAGMKRKRESTGSASTSVNKKARGGSIKPGGRSRK